MYSGDINGFDLSPDLRRPRDQSLMRLTEL